MSATIVRLLLSMLVIAGAPVLFGIIFFVLDGGGVRETTAFLWATIVSAIYLPFAWCAVWFGMIRWTPQRVGSTAIAILGPVFPAALIAAILLSSLRSGPDRVVAILFATMGWAVLALAASTLAWRETRAERGHRLQSLGIPSIPCPTCNYNLTGLREAKCPECGSAFTLDQLFAATTESARRFEG